MSIRIVFALLPLLSACSKESAAPPAASNTSIVLPASLRLDSAPTPAISVLDARANAADGSEVILTGRAKDFVATRAVFTMADMSLKSCADPEDKMGCETPWDYCCEDPKRLSQGTVAIELRDGDKLAMGSAQGWNGLDHLREVVVRGTLKKDDQGNLTMIAKGVYVKPN